MKLFIVIWHHKHGTDVWACSTPKKAADKAAELRKQSATNPDDFIEILETKLDR